MKQRSRVNLVCYPRHERGSGGMDESSWSEGRVSPHRRCPHDATQERNGRHGAARAGTEGSHGVGCQTLLSLELAMPNERQTEAIVRNHFSAYDGQVTIEEQGSSSGRIAKLLRNASKSGTGVGRPDFIIHLTNEPELLIVVECKAQISQHESTAQDAYANHAVDGALYYASHLAKNVDVLAIAVSGTPRRNRVSHFLQLRSQPSAKRIFSDELLAPKDYISGYRDDDGKYRQDFVLLQVFITKLNDTLHLAKVAEGDRALLISAILIALERESFKKAYRAEEVPQALARMTVGSAVESLRDAGVGDPRLAVIEHAFGFLLNSPILSVEPGRLKEVIDSIDDNVNSFRKTHQYRDVLGSLYVEFLRHANSDKGLGIVLTPPHITELFADLARVNAKSIVYDSCAGTGGFLISAMKRMIEDAKGNAHVERRIKQSQLHGVELQSNIYPLAVSNMFIHQDGKANILHGDCFKEIERIAALKPTVGLLNPPYKANKKRDIEELAFVACNLDSLHPGGTSVAIVPMQSALAQSGPIADRKRELLRSHTLEAVCSMPDELFFNSRVGVVSCVMVFTAHKPHPKEKEVFLGYFKDDGFEKRKIGGRQDVEGRWEGIRERWLEHYLNRRAVPGLSVNVQLGVEDEWVAEAYMQTDYSKVADQMFEKTLHDYSTYLFQSRQRGTVSDDRIERRSAPLRDQSTWRPFKLTQLFEVAGTRTTPPRELAFHQHGDHPYVTTQATNNGVDGFYAQWTEDGRVITVDSAVVGFCAYQERAFLASDHVEKLTPRFDMTAPLAMFLVTILNMEQYRYNYGLKRAQKRLRREAIRLPCTKRGDPDWRYIERYIGGLRYSCNLRS